MILNKQNIINITFGAEEIYAKDGYFVFSRFTQSERQTYSQTPDLLMKTAATAGVRLDFYTDTTKMSFDYKMIRASSRNWALFDVFVNGALLHSAINKDVEAEFEGTYEISLPDGKNRVTLFLPNLYAMQIKNFVLSDASVLEPYSHKLSVLSYGDSITQGYDALFPSNSYINQLSIRLDASLINKAIGADVFRPSLIENKDYTPDIVTIAYGTNDWSKLTREDFLRNMPEFLEKIVKTHPRSKIFVITPIWRKDCDRITDVGEFNYAVKSIVEQCEKHEQITVVKGQCLLPNTELLLADGYLHPNDTGMTIYAQSLYEKIGRNIV